MPGTPLTTGGSLQMPLPTADSADPVENDAQASSPPSGFPTSSSVPTAPPSAIPTSSVAPTKSCLRNQVYSVSSPEQLEESGSPQSKALDWMLKEGMDPEPATPCTETLLQLYALAVMYFSLGGDEWKHGSNSDLDKDEEERNWLSGRNFCDWGSSKNGGTDQVVCDESNTSVLELHLGELLLVNVPYFSHSFPHTLATRSFQ